MKPQKKIARPRLPESQIHRAIVQYLDTCVLPGELIYTHIPHGEKRDPRTAGRLKLMGVRAGWPDLVLILKSGAVAFCEIKGRGGSLSPAQVGFRQFLAAIGYAGGDEPPYLCARSVEEFEDWLVALGVRLRIKRLC